MSWSSVSEKQFGEKLIVLNDRINGLSARLYRSKRTLFSDQRPKYLTGGDKAFEPLHKALVKKFPLIDPKQQSQLDILKTIGIDVLNTLSDYYNNFVDVLDLKSHVMEVLGGISGLQMKLDITLNFDFTRNFLDLISNYCSLILLMNKIEDRVLIISLYNQAYIIKHSIQESSFPRLSQMVIDFDKPLRQLHVDINPYGALLKSTLASLLPTYFQRQSNPTHWKNMQPFSLLAEPSKLSKLVNAEINPVNLLSGEIMERWIIFGYLLVYPELNTSDEAAQLWKLALTNSFVITLYRDEILMVHSTALQQFEGVKHFGKRISDVREFLAVACSSSPIVHRERRRYLRMSMRELCLILEDQPGLLGPKVFKLLWVLSYAKEEVQWLIRHAANIPAKKTNLKLNPEDFNDQSIAELLHYIEELRDFALKHKSGVILRFYTKLLSKFDSRFINDFMKTSTIKDDDMAILKSIADTLKELQKGSSKSGDDSSDSEEDFDTETDANVPISSCNLSSVRLDWMRLQICFSAAKYPVPFTTLVPLLSQMNCTIYHTKLVDNVDDLLYHVSDLSILFFYRLQLVEYLRKVRVLHAQHLFINAIPRICSHFVNATHSMCPEEVEFMKSITLDVTFKMCRDISNELCEAIFMAAPVINTHAFELLPVESFYWYENRKKSKKEQKRLANADTNTTARTRTGTGAAKVIPKKELPGHESLRRDRANMTHLDQLSAVIGDLCCAINHKQEITIFGHTVLPVEIFLFDFRARLMECFRDLVTFQPENKMISRPTEVVNCIQALSEFFMKIQNFLPVDIRAVLTICFQEHCQPRDSTLGRPTITCKMVQFYADIILPYLTSDGVIYSPHLKTFVCIDRDPMTHIDLLDYLHRNELTALVELLSADGVMLLLQIIVKEMASIWQELKRLILDNRQTLEGLHNCSNTGDIVKSRELATHLQFPNDILHRLRSMGVLLTFSDMLKDVLQVSLDMHIPFLMDTGRDLYNISLNLAQPSSLDVPEVQRPFNLDQVVLANRLAGAMGFPTGGYVANASLMEAIRDTVDTDYAMACLLPVCLAHLMPWLTKNDSSCVYNPHLGTLNNNMHCIVPAVVNLVTVLLTSTGHSSELPERWFGFLRMVTSNLLPLESEAVKQQSSNNSVRSNQAVYILLDTLIQTCPYLDYYQLELGLPYSFIRCAYHDSIVNPSHFLNRSK